MAFVTPVAGYWLELEMGSPWGIDLMTHHTKRERSTMELHLAPNNKRNK